MKKKNLLLALLFATLCACTPSSNDIDSDPQDPNTEITNPDNEDDNDQSGGDNEIDDDNNSGNENEDESQATFSINEPERTIDYDSDLVIFTVECEDITKLTVKINLKNQDWVFFDGAEENRLFFWFSKNDGDAPRIATITVSDAVSGKSITLTVTQLNEVKPTLTPIPQSFENIEAVGGTFEFKLEGPVGYTQIFFRYDGSIDEPGWYILNEIETPQYGTVGDVTYNYELCVAPNTSTEPRSSVITITCYEYDIEFEIPISQKGYTSDGEQSKLYYTTRNGKTITTGMFDVPVLSNEYKNGQGVITFDGTLRQFLSFSSPNLVSVTIPDCVEYIGSYAIADCDYLEKVVIGSGVKEFGDFIFWGSSTSADLEVILNSNIYEGAFEDSFITKLTIGSNVTEIGDYALNDCQYLEEITFNEGLKRIGDNAFAGNCFFYILPNSLEYIGEEAFIDCDNLIAVSIGSNSSAQIKEIGRAAFAETSLTTLVCYATNPPKYGEYALYKVTDDGMDVTTMNCAIFVPEGSWTRYKNASGWKAHASLISVITPELEEGMKDWK